MKKVIARLYIKMVSVEAFKEHAVDLIQKTRKEKGCIFYSLFEDVSNPGEFLFYEEYQDQAALDVHCNSEYLQAFRSKVEGMQTKDKIVDVL